MIADVPPTSPSAILAEERLRVHTERVPVERVVIGKRDFMGALRIKR